MRCSKGIALLFLCSVASQLLLLNTLSWVLDSFLQSGSIIIVIVILFQPEIRRVLERLGRSGKQLGNLFDATTYESEALVRDVQRAILSMSRRRVGMLLVVERKTALGDIINTGTLVDGVISGALLETSLNQIRRCTTALSSCAARAWWRRVLFAAVGRSEPCARTGTRHRAALGISTVSDSVTIVVLRGDGRHFHCPGRQTGTLYRLQGVAGSAGESVPAEDQHAVPLGETEGKA